VTENRSAVICPHCGAENPRSLLVTMCQQCRGDLSQAAAQPSAPARTSPTQQRTPLRPREPEPRPPELPPVAERPPRTAPHERVSRPAAYEMEPVPPSSVARRDEPLRASSESPAVGILICLLSIALFGIGFAILLWLTD
jgi:hypothetical protein